MRYAAKTIVAIGALTLATGCSWMRMEYNPMNQLDPEAIVCPGIKSDFDPKAPPTTIELRDEYRKAKASIDACHNSIDAFTEAYKKLRDSN